MSNIDLEPFEDFMKRSPQVDDLRKRLQWWRGLSEREQNEQGQKDPFTSPNRLGHGVDKTAFLVGPYVLKILHILPQTTFERQVAPLARSVGIVGTEQLVTASEEDGVDGMIVTKHIPGTLTGNMHVLALERAINEDNIAALRDTVEALKEVDVFVDTPGNVLGNALTGFSVIDPVNGVKRGTNDLATIMDEITRFIPERFDSRVVVERPKDHITMLRAKYEKALRQLHE